MTEVRPVTRAGPTNASGVPDPKICTSAPDDPNHPQTKLS